MPDLDTAATAITAVLSAGGAGAAATFITARSGARKANAEAGTLDARRGPEVDSVVVQGAETAVLTMKATLEATLGRLAAVEAERDAALAEVAALRTEVNDLRRKVWDANKAVEVAQAAADLLGRKVEEFLDGHRHQPEGTP